MEQRILEDLLLQGLSINEIAKRENCSPSTVRYWMKRYELKPNFVPFFAIQRKPPAYSESELREAVKDAKSRRDVFAAFGLTDGTGNYRILNHYLKVWNIDISHFETQSQIMSRLHRERKVGGKRRLEDILVENSTYRSTKDLKTRLYKAGLKQRRCEMEGCGQTEEWMGKRMSLILDHINGDPTDNRLENLRIVCPNCNATLPTFCGKRR